MAVPSSGSLSMLDIAQEALYATYGTGSVTGPISMYDMMNGGNTKGSGNSYPSLNTSCDPHPGTSLNTPLKRVVTLTTNSCNPSSSLYNVQDVWVDGLLSVGDTVYTSPCGTSTLAAGEYFPCGASILANCDDCEVFTVNSSGVVTAAACEGC